MSPWYRLTSIPRKWLACKTDFSFPLPFFHVIKYSNCPPIHLKRLKWVTFLNARGLYLENSRKIVLEVWLTVVPQSPSPTLLSHSFKLSFILIISLAPASIEASKMQPSLVSSRLCWSICQLTENELSMKVSTKDTLYRVFFMSTNSLFLKKMQYNFT